MKQKSCLMFKVFHKLGPSYLSQPFNRANLIHSHGTRGHDYNFVIPEPNTNFLKNSLEYEDDDVQLYLNPQIFSTYTLISKRGVHIYKLFTLQIKLKIQIIVTLY